MMMDIFSSFDPFIYYLPKLSSLMFWLLSLIMIMLIPTSMFFSPTSSNLLSLLIIDIMFSQTSRTKGMHMKSFMSIIPPMFLMIILLNLLGLMPYIFSTSSHLVITLSLGLPLWAALIISSFNYNIYASTANLLPGGAPEWLNPFLVIIETLSTLVRPLTLSFRLAANMTAGHVVLGLITSYLISILLNSLMSISSIFSLFVAMSYIMFEIGICIIQAYIFCLLITLYSDDHA